MTRRTKYDLNKAQERSHILEGLLKALDHIDEVIHIIRASANAAEAKKNLMEHFDLSDAQAQAIVDMRLRALTGLEREKLENEYKELMARIEQLKAILADRKVLLGVIRREILTVSEKYGDDRRTSIGFDEYDLSMEDLIPRENTVITMTKLGYIKRMTDPSLPDVLYEYGKSLSSESIRDSGGVQNRKRNGDCQPSPAAAGREDYRCYSNAQI